ESGRVWAVVAEPCFVDVHDSQQLVASAGRIAIACRKRKAPFLVFTNSLVFDGNSVLPYIESDAPNPVCPVGKMLNRFERAALEAFDGTLVVRTGEILDPTNQGCPLGRILKSFARSDGVELKVGELISPAYLPHVAHVSLDLLLDGESGVWHLSNGGVLSWSELATAVACAYGDINAALQAQPRMRALSTGRGQCMPSLEAALTSYLSEYESGQDREFELRHIQPKRTGAFGASEI
ncbi:MAG TPA: sugar nucleotide-binding protein, partial [Polyangiaceae bacterium]